MVSPKLRALKIASRLTNRVELRVAIDVSKSFMCCFRNRAKLIDEIVEKIFLGERRNGPGLNPELRFVVVFDEPESLKTARSQSRLQACLTGITHRPRPTTWPFTTNQEHGSYEQLLGAIAVHRVANRHDRFEPRARNRNARKYNRLVRPRHEAKRRLLKILNNN